MDDDTFRTDRPEPGSNKPYITKGTKIHAEWFKAKPPGSFSLSGMQMKFAATQVTIVGVVRHLRGDDPVRPKKVHLYVEVEGEVPAGLTVERPYGCSCPGHDKLVVVDMNHVVAVL